MRAKYKHKITVKPINPKRKATYSDEELAGMEKDPCEDENGGVILDITSFRFVFTESPQSEDYSIDYASSRS